MCIYIHIRARAHAFRICNGFCFTICFTICFFVSGFVYTKSIQTPIQKHVRPLFIGVSRFPSLGLVLRVYRGLEHFVGINKMVFAVVCLTNLITKS